MEFIRCFIDNGGNVSVFKLNIFYTFITLTILYVPKNMKQGHNRHHSLLLLGTIPCVTSNLEPVR